MSYFRNAIEDAGGYTAPFNVFQVWMASYAKNPNIANAILDIYKK